MSLTTENSGACIVGGRRRKAGKEMVKIEITSGTLINGKHYSASKKPISVSASLARTLLSSNKAVPVADEPRKLTIRQTKTKVK